MVIVQKIEDISKPQQFVVGKNEKLTLLLFAFSAGNYHAEVSLIGEGSSTDILGIVLGKEAKEVRINTVQNHQAPHTTSNLLIKSALSYQSQLFYEGYIKVGKKAQQTNAYQRNENLMLSAQAKAETKPALEILANDVRCTHSATIGKIDSEQLFYLKSRGMSERKASQLIIEGFFQSILDKIEDEKLKTEITDNIYSLALSS